MVVVGMTPNLTPTPYGFTITTKDMAVGTLNHPGKVRADKVYTLSQKIVLKSFGKVNAPTLDRIRQMLEDLCRP
jgi:hypothetical protein